MKTNDTLRYAVATSLLVLSAISVAFVFVLLDEPPSELNLVMTGSLAGASTATIALLVQPRGWLTLTSGLARLGIVAAWVSFVAGFLAGGFSVMAALALIGRGSTTGNSGAAIIGGLYGLALGAYWSRVVLSEGEQETVLGSALLGIEQRVGRTPIVNYRGSVYAEATSSAYSDRLVEGRLTVWFVGGNERVAPWGTRRAGVAEGIDRWPPPVPLVVEGGEDRKQVEFVITAIGGRELDSVPRRQLVSIPARGLSERYSFTLVRQGPEVESGSTRSDSKETGDERSGPTPRPVLLDIMQSGRSVQVIEVTLKTEDKGALTSE